MSLRRDSNLGELDFQIIHIFKLYCIVKKNDPKRKTTYQKYSEEDRFKIGKYASENGAAAAIRKFKKSYPDIKESTIRGFKSKYERGVESC